jgi:hypothetical protein
MGIKTKLKANPKWQVYADTRDITVVPSVHFDRDTTFFTIGSCFANELRHALEQRSFDVLPHTSQLIHHHFGEEFKRRSTWGDWDERSNLQFYNTFSIRQEFDKAFGVWRQADDDYFLVERNGRTEYWDPYRRLIYADTPASFAAIKRALDDAMKSAVHCADVAVITLGLTEVFFRNDNGLAINSYRSFFRDKVRFRATDFQDNYENVDRICELYFGAYPDKKIALTVSPVPLDRSFTGIDVVVANTISKSTLRTVAAEIARKWPNVLYFPSYEIAMNHDNSFRKDDLRHVTRERVNSIVDTFIAAHFDTAPALESV